MMHIRTLALALALATGPASSVFADDGGEQQHRRWDGDDRWDDDRDDRGDRGGRWDDRGDRHDHDGRWDDGRDGRWGRWVPVRFVNQRDRVVTLYLDGRYLGRVAPFSRERIALPPGHHVVTYQVGHRPRWHEVSVSAIPGQRNRVVIEGRRWGGWGGY